MNWGDHASGGLEESVIPDNYVDPPFEFDAPRWNNLDSNITATDPGWFAIRHPLHESTRQPPKALLPPEVIAQCAEARRLQKLKSSRISTSIVSPPVVKEHHTTPPARMAAGNSNSGGSSGNHVAQPSIGASVGTPHRAGPRRVGTDCTPTRVHSIGTPNSIRRKAAKRVSSGLALRQHLFSSPHDNKESERTQSRPQSGGIPVAKGRKSGESHVDDEHDEIARLLEAHNSKVQSNIRDENTDADIDAMLEESEEHRPLRVIQPTADIARIAEAAFKRGSDSRMSMKLKRRSVALAGPPRRFAAGEEVPRPMGRKSEEAEEEFDEIKELLKQHNRQIAAQTALYDASGHKLKPVSAKPQPLRSALPLSKSLRR